MKRNLQPIVLLTLVLMVALVVSACGASPAAEAPAPAATATEAPAPAPTEAPTEPPAEPTPEPTPTEAPEPTAEPTPTEAPAQEEPPPAETEPETPPEGEAAGPRTFVVVPEESEVSYEVDEEFFGGALDRLGIAAGLTKTIGKTSEIDGSLTIDSSASPPQLVSGEFAVDISTLSSDQSSRDNQIRQRYLESARFPIANFVATGIQNAPDSYAEGQPVTFQLAGDLTVREITLPVVFDVEATLEEDTISGEATTLVKMSDFGVTPPEFANVFSVGDDTVIRIMLSAVEQAQ